MKSKLKSYLLLLILALSVPLKAQDKTIDSLKLALKNAKNDTSRCNILSILAETAGDEEWPIFNETLYNLSEKNLLKDDQNTFYLKYRASSLNNKGVLAQVEGDISKALNFFNDALTIYERLGMNDAVASSINNVASIYFNLGENEKSLAYFKKGLRIHRVSNNKKGMADCLNNIAFQIAHQGDIPHAINYFNEALAMYEQIKDRKGEANVINNIAVIYNNQNDLKNALIYYKKSFFSF